MYLESQMYIQLYECCILNNDRLCQTLDVALQLQMFVSKCPKTVNEND